MAAPDPVHALVLRAQAGDRSAFDALALELRGRLEALIRTRLGAELARALEVDDVAQETFLKAYESIDRFRWKGKDSFFRWLGGIAEHVILNWARSRPRERAGAWNADAGEADIAQTAPSPSKAARRNERFERFETVLESLSPDYRTVVRLARLEGPSIEETARRMGRSPNAVSHLLLRALRKLRSAFGDTESLSLPDRALREEGERDGH
jgi:RNA polymerase sigma-70 factor (ECF subfamily)